MQNFKLAIFEVKNSETLDFLKQSRLQGSSLFLAGTTMFVFFKMIQKILDFKEIDTDQNILSAFNHGKRITTYSRCMASLSQIRKWSPAILALRSRWSIAVQHKSLWSTQNDAGQLRLYKVSEPCLKQGKKQMYQPTIKLLFI